MNCDRIAPLYAWLEYAAFGPALQHRRCEFLNECRDRHRVLMLGEGDGRFLRELALSGARVAIDYVDASLVMAKLARRRCPSESRATVAFHTADALSFTFPQNYYDLVISHFFLDCFEQEELETLIQRVTRACQANAQWIISDFAYPDRGWRALRAKAWIGSLYRLFDLATGLKVRRIADWRPLLAQHGFQLHRARKSNGGMLISEMWERSPAGLTCAD